MDQDLKPGIVVPLMPFLTEDQEYDFPSVRRQVDHYIDSRVSGIFILTNCGQADRFTLDENKELASVVVNSVRNRVPIYVGTGTTKEKDKEEYFRRAVESGKQVFIGEDNVLYGNLELGASGGIVALANLIPKELVAIYEMYQEDKSKQSAKLLQDRINDSLLSTIYYGYDKMGGKIDQASALKNAMHQVLQFGSPQMATPRPTYSTNRSEGTRIHASLKSYGLIKETSKAH